jgi:hypothetical protein
MKTDKSKRLKKFSERSRNSKKAGNGFLKN